MIFTLSFFLYLNDGKLIGYNLITQKYYEVDESSFESLRNLSAHAKDKIENDALTKLYDLGFENTSMKIYWDGDVPSHIIHQSSRIHSENNPPLTKEEFVQQYIELSLQMDYVHEKDRINGKTIQLPIPTLTEFENTTLAYCFKNRRTSREFNKDPIELKYLICLFWPYSWPGERRYSHLRA